METILCNTEPTFQKLLTESMVAHGIHEGAVLFHLETCLECRILLEGIGGCMNNIESAPVGRRYCELNDKWSQHIWSWLHKSKIPAYQKATKKTTRYELGAREFTLTYSPKWFGDDEARLEMVRAIHKLIKYYRDEIIDFRAVGEVGTNGLSHVHCFYKLQGGLKITDKNFKRAWKYWNPKKPLQRGFEGGHHASVRNESDFLGYIDKDIETAWLDKNISRENINACKESYEESAGH